MIKLTKSEIMMKIRKSNLKFAWINTFSDLKLIDLKNDNFMETWLDSLIEAKIFDENREISIMPYDNEDYFSVVEFDGNSKEYVEERQILNKNKSPFINKNKNVIDMLVIRNYLNYDDDGQAYIYYTKLCNIERGYING
ncbi:hypothetical protein FDB28_11190 [Clostridium botulinum]|uniref:hypothetical protein n=1 Tax=Clostridium sp. VAP23 TaxID=2949981 RepID=UPI0013F1219E|nr:hypothetical protein [Clostridium sp. VAP23]NFN94638.1 hypothetical protein [Clostridium botulinum]NFS30473.1 hypothetical protein [Clostridium botulinum]NFS53828.1 hypothetical protein [Clostridium botulinum]NFS96929.1 hypothetical protein [Clostridium botulinum]NFT18841.1 hypothetical protein [Clostridium botulinum]